MFLSYAREDAAAARRIAEALRGFGIEVWFDESELRGGDQWDAKIRGQIKTCALFLPIISATTQARDEAYFRLEWKLADDRSHLMAAGKRFIVPVVIDSTREAGASVPESFGRAQWTRLADGVPSTAFIEQVKRLLEGKPAAAARATTPVAGVGDPGPASARPATKKPIPGWTWGALTAVVVGIATAVSVSNREVRAPLVTPPKPATAPSVEADRKSIAVLPFANLSTDKENEFFADGVHDDVITSLAKIRDLKVISRTSVLAYRDTASRNLKKIAEELGVTTILEGSIRRVGGKVRMNAQLIDARSDEHLWADTFEGDTGDIFALQAKLTQQIASALKATLSSGERSLIERRPTQDAQAYEFYQRAKLGRQAIASDAVRADYEAVIQLYQQAVDRDPGFALAHGELSTIHGLMYWFGAVDPSPERRALAGAALAEAERLAPDSPETRKAQGYFAYLCENDWNKALGVMNAAERDLPNDDQVQYLLAVSNRRRGHLAEALNYAQRSVDLNPHDRRATVTLVESASALRRFAFMAEIAPRILAQFPDDSVLGGLFVDARFGLSGDRESWLREWSTVAPTRDDQYGLEKAYAFALRRGDLAAAEQILADPRLRTFSGGGSVLQLPVALFRANLARLRGNNEDAKRYGAEAIEEFRVRAWSPRQQPAVLAYIALAKVCADNPSGVGEMMRAVDELAQRDRFLVLEIYRDAASSLSAAGKFEESLDILRRLFSGPSTCSPNEIRNDPYFAKLKADPRFEEILNSAKPL